MRSVSVPERSSSSAMAGQSTVTCSWCGDVIEREEGWRAQEVPGARRAAFCRLEHVVPWAIQGAHWDAGEIEEPGGLIEAPGDVRPLRRAARRRACGARPPPRGAPHPGRLLLGRSHGRVGEGRRALALAAAAPRPSSSARSSIAAITNATCSSKSTPSSSEPSRTSSRFTPAAKLGCFSFFLTDLGVMPWIPSGRTYEQAAMKPDSSSTANSVFAMRDSRGTPRNVAWPATASISSWG